MKKFIYLLFLLLSIRMIELVNIGDFSLKIIDIITIVLACITFVFDTQHKKREEKANSIDIFLMLYIVYSLVNVFIAGDKTLAYSDFYRLIVSFLAYYVITTNFRYSEFYEKVFIKASKVYISGAIISIAYSIYIFYIKGLPEIKAFGLNAINSFNVRFTGLESDANTYCMYLMIALVMLVKLYEVKQISKKKFLFTITIMILSIILTFSRSGLIMLVVYLVFFSSENLKLKLRVLTMAAIVFFILMFTNPYGFQDIMLGRLTNVFTTNSSQDVSIYLRKMYYNITVTEFKSSPIIGIGRGNFAEIGSQYFNLPEGANSQGVFYQVACELGIIGLFLFCSILIITLIKLHKVAKIYKNSNYSWMSELDFSLIILYIISSLFGNFDSTREFWYILAIASSSIEYFYSNKFEQRIVDEDVKLKALE